MLLILNFLEPTNMKKTCWWFNPTIDFNISVNSVHAYSKLNYLFRNLIIQISSLLNFNSITQSLLFFSFLSLFPVHSLSIKKRIKWKNFFEILSRKNFLLSQIWNFRSSRSEDGEKNYGRREKSIKILYDMMRKYAKAKKVQWLLLYMKEKVEINNIVWWSRDEKKIEGMAKESWK